MKEELNPISSNISLDISQPLASLHFRHCRNGSHTKVNNTYFHSSKNSLWNEKYTTNTRKWKEKKGKDLEGVGLKYLVSRSKVNINFILITTFITLKSYFLMAVGKNKSLVSYFCSSHHFFLDRSNITPSEIFHEYTTYTNKYIFTISSIFMDKW